MYCHPTLPCNPAKRRKRREAFPSPTSPAAVPQRARAPTHSHNVDLGRRQTSSGDSASGDPTSPALSPTPTPTPSATPTPTPTPGDSQSSPASQSSPTDSAEGGSDTGDSSDSSSSTPSDSISVTPSAQSSAPSSTVSSPSSSPSDTGSSTPSQSNPPSSSSTPTPSSSSTPISSGSSSSSASSSSQTSSLSSTSASATSQSSSSSSSTPSSSSASSSDVVYSTIVTTDSAGIRTTVVTAIPTTLVSSGSAGTSNPTNRAIIAGSIVGAVAFLSLALALVLFYRRHNHKKLNFFRFIAPKPRSMLLAGEDLDDYDLSPPMHTYEDYPRTSSSSRSAVRSPAGSFAYSGYAPPSLRTAPFPPSATPEPGAPSTGSPHLLGMRASDSGSIFQEAVWPPPRALVDPLAGSHDDLTRIVDDVMGPAAPAPRPIRGHQSSMSDESDGTATAQTHTHTRAGSRTALLGGSPVSPHHAPLFVANAGPGRASPGERGSPTGRMWLERSPKKAARSVEAVQEGVGEAL
ncbi:hypothetical protein B0H21DRAFT_32369 [Amylocystis lapponica]|nr:hypothetical protein B0H21DRAFT_32369 [Amylocystis lapponica]